MTRTITIVGGGFSGVITAVNVARFARQPTRVVVVNSGSPFGRGIAYGTNRPEHLLNVAARNMSALADHPTHFVDWLATRSDFRSCDPADLREQFIPRRIYGDYLRSLVEFYRRPVQPDSQTRLDVMEDEAVDIEPGEHSGARVLLKEGDSLESSAVLLATGNQPPAAIKGAAELGHDDRYCDFPWSDWHRKLPPPGGRIVLLGTGLTMVDVVVTLGELGWEGEVVAVSRHGMLPRSHFRGIAYPDYLPDDTRLDLERLVKLVQQHCARLQEMSQNPGIAVDKLRPHTQRLWQGFSTEDKKRFLRDHAASWNVIRHRIAPAIHEKMTDALDTGRLKIQSGSIESIHSGVGSLEIRVLGKGGERKTITGDQVINCTGPQTSFSRSGSILFQNLLRRGLVRPDPLDMGIEAGDDFRVVDAEGNIVHWLFAMGPLLKGSLWETIAVPELRVQALRIAQTLADSGPLGFEEAEAVIEYCI